MTTPSRIYLDNAATSWPKPTAVYEAVDHYLRELGAPAGRSAYREAVEVERLVTDARRQLGILLGNVAPERVIFTSNGTDSLNLALHGVLRAGDHVITSVVEHNSVLRPLRHLEQAGVVEVSRVACDGSGLIDPADMRREMRRNTRMIALSHASNVTGAIQPAEDVARIAAEHELLFLLDAAQTLGHLEVDVHKIGAHLVAAPGHKALLGPLGIGLLYIAPGVEQQLAPIRQGGTGTQSETDLQPDSLPDKYESGNHNVPAIVGLGAAVNQLRAKGIGVVEQHARTLLTSLLEGLAEIEQVTLHGPADARRQSAIQSVSVAGYDPQEVATMLDEAYSIQVRAGLHCAPLMHDALGTRAHGGTLRLSLGQFNTLDQIETVITGMTELAAAAPPN
ncbi:MAG TPA: aminotransferase class V-fold PLP-dependent enzyme [Pirellulaceae bacterium]|jgi:cysteine desulfurase family protein|nr:aminotransferase class V-fold PLP-dependent enzyme [Pirellulaceae bacterium]